MATNNNEEEKKVKRVSVPLEVDEYWEAKAVAAGNQQTLAERAAQLIRKDVEDQKGKDD